MKVKTSDLVGPALDWAVAIANGWVRFAEDSIEAGSIWYEDKDKAPFCQYIAVRDYHPSTDWAQGGAVIDEKGIGFFCNRTAQVGKAFKPDAGADWRAFAYNKHAEHHYGPTPLIAAMRCYVASKLGDEVEVPDELMET